MRSRALVGLTSRAGHDDVNKHKGERGQRHRDRNKGTRPLNHCSEVHFVSSIHQVSNPDRVRLQSRAILCGSEHAKLTSPDPFDFAQGKLSGRSTLPSAIAQRFNAGNCPQCRESRQGRQNAPSVLPDLLLPYPNTQR